MKKTITTLLTALLAFTVTAQTVPNGDMENWTWSGKQPPFDWEEPTGWSSSNPMTEFSSAGVRRVAPGASGDSACQIATANLFGEYVPGFIVNGEVELNFSTFTPDFAKSGSPVSTGYHYLHGKYKFTATTAEDSAFVVVAYKKWNSSTNKTDTVALVTKLLPPAANFTEFQVDISEVGSDAVDTVVVVFASSNPENAKAGGVLIVDDIDLDMINSTGYYPSKVQLNIYPNPANNLVSVTTGNNEQITHVSLVDITGKTVLSKDYLNAAEAKLDLDELLTGVYFVQVTTNKGTATQKLTVIK